MSAQKGTERRDYSHYDQMSTAELERLLRLDFQLSEETPSDLDAILYISDLLAKRNGPSDADAAWAQFQSKYRPYADGSSLYDFGDRENHPISEAAQRPPSPVRPRPARRLRRLAVLAALLAACLLGAIAARAAGVDIWGAIARWTDETFFFVSTGSDAPSGSGAEEALAQIQASLKPLGMANWFPAWYPDGFVPGELEVNEQLDSVSAHVTFQGEDKFYSLVLIHYTQPPNGTGTFEKDDTPVEEYVHNGQTFYILSNVNTLTATASTGEFMTMICGALTREEIKSVIDSIPAAPPMPEEEQPMHLLAEEWESLYCPQIPEGFEKSEANYDEDPLTGNIFWSELYVRGQESLAFGITKYAGSPASMPENDDTLVEEYVYRGVTHYIFSSNGTTTAAWMAENTEYYMQATDGAVDMKALIRSAYGEE